MANLRGPGTTEAIEPENLELEFRDEAPHYYSNLPYRYGPYSTSPTSTYNWYYGPQPWGWLAGWPGGMAQIPPPPAVCSGF